MDLVLDRYEAQRVGAKNYAQVDVAEEADYWGAVYRVVLSLKNKLLALRSSGAIGSITIDAGFSFSDNLMAGSTVIPSAIAQLAGEIGIDIEISIYRTEATKSGGTKRDPN